MDPSQSSPGQRDVTRAPASSWSTTYGSKHRLKRVTVPNGVLPPKKVRIYERCGHFLLQWWDPAHKKTLNSRIDGDVLEAIVRAREIDDRLLHYRASGRPAGRVGHDQLVAAYLDDLTKRADAGEIDPRTVDRYRAPLQCHYLAFVHQPEVCRSYPLASDVNRDFQLEFCQFLQFRHVASNGSPDGVLRPMRGQRFVLDVARSMFHWAADPVRGNLLPEGFRNPFRRMSGSSTTATMLGEPDITVSMVTELLSACDAFQLPIFATVVLYGLRPDELGWLFWEDVHGGWVRAVCHPDLSYQTKGRRDKHFPILRCLQAIWPRPVQEGKGLLFRRRTAGGSSIQLVTKSDAIAEFQRIRQAASPLTASKERRARDEALGKVHQLRYGHLKHEFERLSRALNWPKAATLKDLRHLFATSLENAGVPESYRRFLMGHAPGRAAIVSYTHLNKLRDHYMRFVDTEFAPIVTVIERQAQILWLTGDS